MTFFRKRDVSEVAAVLDAMFAVLVESLTLIRKHFNVSDDAYQFEEFRRSVGEFKVRLTTQPSVIQ